MIKNIKDAIEDDYELIWESVVIENEDGTIKTTTRPIKLITTEEIDSKEFHDYMREQEPGYRVFRKY